MSTSTDMPLAPATAERPGEVAVRLLANVAGLMLLGLALALTLDVLLRWTLSAPILGLYEVAELGFAVVMALSLVWTNARQSHVTMGILAQLTGRDAAPRLVAAGINLAAFVLFVWFLARHASTMANRGETTLVLGLRTAPFWMAACAAVTLAALTQLYVFVVELGAYLRDRGRRWRDMGPPAVMVAAALAVLLIAGHYAAGLGAGPRILAAFAVLYLLALAHVPIGVALTLTGLGALWLQMGLRPALLVGTNNLTSSLSSVDLAAVPLFLLMGNFAIKAGFADDIFRAAAMIFARMRGGHALATVMGCAGFGAISGSSVATTATLGGVAFREMRQRGYAPAFSTGTIAAGGTLGALIPPSVILIIYCVIAEVSIAQAFIAALVPGLLAVALYAVSILIQVRIRPAIAPAPDPTDSFAPIRALRIAWRPIILFAAMLGGLYGGVFTAQEAAAVGAGFAFLAWLSSGRASLADLFEALRDAAGTSAGLYLLVIGANIFGSYLNFAGMPQALAAVINPEILPVWAVLSLLTLMYLVLGSIFDSVAAVVVTVPFVLPIILSMGFDPIWWGVVTLTLVEIGMISPPIGMNVFVMKAVVGDQVKISTIFGGVMPFLAADLLRMVLLIAFPVLSLWLVGVLS